MATLKVAPSMERVLSIALENIVITQAFNLYLHVGSFQIALVTPEQHPAHQRLIQSIQPNYDQRAPKQIHQGVPILYVGQFQSLNIPITLYHPHPKLNLKPFKSHQLLSLMKENLGFIIGEMQQIS